ncbi:MAG TPA: DUF6065 family protein [Caulobacteraceae bacterium]|nr:DUF6065 family protein [Caulobacteraceae bacterium]
MADKTLAAPELTCFPLWPDPPPLTPARSERAWMDETTDRYAYRCIPLSIANASGWELALPFGFEAAWYGGTEQSAIQVRSHDPRAQHFVTSHFGHGVITFHTGWLFRTSPGWAVWTRGSPNTAKDGLAPLDGLVETDWLPFPFTMNWRFLRPGVARFEAGEPFCFITLAPHALLDAVQPRIASLDDDPELKAAHADWSRSRSDFSQRLKARDDEAVAQRWQRTYVQGRGAPQGDAPDYHLTRRRLKPPV